MLKTFKFDDKLIRAQKNGDEIWFWGKDVAEVLGYKRSGNAIRYHVSECDRRKVLHSERPQGGASQMYQINEPGVYCV